MDPFCFIYIPVAGILLGILYILGLLVGPLPDSDSSHPNLETLVLGAKITSRFIYRLIIRIVTIVLLPIEKIWILLGHDSYTFTQAVCWRLQIMRARYLCAEIDKLNVRTWLAPILGNRKVVDFCNTWKDGMLLCQLMYRIAPVNDLKPSTLKSEGAYRRISFALQYVRDRLFVRTSVTPKDVLTLTPETEYVLLELLVRIQVACAKLGIDTANLKSPTLDSLSDEEDAKNEIVSVEGPGLQSGRVGERACFTIEFYTRYLDVVVDIRGCCGEFRTRRITNRSPRRKVETGSLDNTPQDSENEEPSYVEQVPSRVDNNIRFEYEIFNNIVNVTYYPRNTGVYEIKIFFMGRTVSGSPFRPIIYDKSVWLPSPKSTPPLLKSRSSSEERFRCYSWSHNVSPVKPFKRRIVKQVVNIGDEEIEVLPQEGISISEAMRNKISSSRRSVSFDDDGFAPLSKDTARRSSLSSSPLRTDKNLHLDLKQKIKPQLEDIAQSPVTDSNRVGGEGFNYQPSPASAANKSPPLDLKFSPVTIKSFDSLLDAVKAAQVKKDDSKLVSNPEPEVTSPRPQTDTETRDNEDKSSEESPCHITDLVEESDLCPESSRDSTQESHDPHSDNHVAKNEIPSPVFEGGGASVDTLTATGLPEFFESSSDKENDSILNIFREARKSSLQAPKIENNNKLHRQYSLTLDSISSSDVTRINAHATPGLVAKETDDLLGKVDCNSNLEQSGVNGLRRDFLEVNIASEKDLVTPVEDVIPIKTYPTLGIDKTVVTSELQGPIEPQESVKCRTRGESPRTSPDGTHPVREIRYKAAREASIDNSSVPGDVDELFDRIYCESSDVQDEADPAGTGEQLSSPGSSSSWVVLEASEGESPGSRIPLQEDTVPQQDPGVTSGSECFPEGDPAEGEESGKLGSESGISPAGSSDVLTKVSMMTNFVEEPTSELALIPTPDWAVGPLSAGGTAVERRRRFGLTPLNSLDEEDAQRTGPFRTMLTHSDTALLRVPHGTTLSPGSAEMMGAGREHDPSDVESMSSLFIPPMKEKTSNVQSAHIRVNEFVNDLAKQLVLISETTDTCLEDPNPEEDQVNVTEPPAYIGGAQITETYTSYFSGGHHYGNDMKLESRMEDINGDTYLIVESFGIPSDSNVATSSGSFEISYSSSEVETLVASCNDLECADNYSDPHIKTTSPRPEPHTEEITKPTFPRSSGKAGFLGVKPYTESDRVQPISFKISKQMSCVHNLTPTPFKPFVIESHLKKVSHVNGDEMSVQSQNPPDPTPEGGDSSRTPVAVLDLSDFVLLENDVGNQNIFRKYSADNLAGVTETASASHCVSESVEGEPPERGGHLGNEIHACNIPNEKGEAVGLIRDLVEVSATFNQSHDTQDLIESKIVKTRRKYWDKVEHDGPDVHLSHPSDVPGMDECHLDISKTRQVFEASEGALPCRNVSTACVKKVWKDIPPWTSQVQEHDQAWKTSRSLQSDSLCCSRTDDMFIHTPNVLDVSRSYPTFYSSPSSPLSSSPRQSSSFRRKLESWEARTSPVPSRPTSRNISYDQHISEMNKLTSSVTEWENKARHTHPNSLIPNVTPKLDSFLSSSSIKSGSYSSSSHSDSGSIRLTPQSSTESEDPPLINTTLFKKSQQNSLKPTESDEDIGESPLTTLRYPEDYINEYPYLPKNTLCSRRRFTPGTQIDLVSLNNLNNYL